MGLGFALARYYPLGQRVDSDDKPESPQPDELNDATSKAVAESLLRANTLFKRRQGLLMMNKQYHESTNIHKTYGL